ncbi:50S ribosomal protein L16 [Candidatus Pacearchaeota archaeon]|nr:50S ribosomal protein L16 [Candidatus Pacearchaeota archaeon]
MALRKASAYSKFPARPFTRTSKNKSKSYIKTIPFPKVVKYHIGSQKDYREGKHTHAVRLFSEERVQLRDNALEAARQALTKVMDEKALGQYYLAVRVFPHHFLRENKTAAGAGADRMSTGMTQSYGIIIGRAAQVGAGQEVFFISCVNERIARIARDALIAVKAKLPCATRIVFQELGK